jgi:hypothetical protein
VYHAYAGSKRKKGRNIANITMAKYRS